MWLAHGVTTVRELTASTGEAVERAEAWHADIVRKVRPPEDLEVSQLRGASVRFSYRVLRGDILIAQGVPGDGSYVQANQQLSVVTGGNVDLPKWLFTIS